MKKSLSLTFVLVALAVFTGRGVAQQQQDKQKLPPVTVQTGPAPTGPSTPQRVTTIKTSKSNSSDLVATTPLVMTGTTPQVMTGKVTEVTNQARTFTVAVVFSAAKLNILPTVNEIIDVTYTVSPGGGAMVATTIKGSKSNGSYRVATAGPTTAVVSTSSSDPDGVATQQVSPRLSQGRVLEVNNRARTFTIAVVFSGANLRQLPTVGQVVDVTYSESVNGAPARASNLNLSKSNIN
jgi:hypothetical protein